VLTSAEWKLHEEIFHRVCYCLGPCRVDLFATRLNHQLDNYISWRPGPGAIGTDALQVNWRDLEGYAFPPFALIGRCLQKVRVEQSTIVLIAPIWRNQPWYPSLLDLIVEFPLLLPQRKDMLKDPKGQLHPLLCQNKLRLAAWKVSSNSTQQLEFRTRLQNCRSQDGVEEQTWPTNQDGISGLAGVREGRLIPFLVEYNPS